MFHINISDIKTKPAYGGEVMINLIKKYILLNDSFIDDGFNKYKARNI